MCPDLRDPLREHLSTFTEAQRVHIPSAVQEIVMHTYSVPAPNIPQATITPAIPQQSPGTVMLPNIMPPLKDEMVGGHIKESH